MILFLVTSVFLPAPPFPLLRLLFDAVRAHPDRHLFRRAALVSAVAGATADHVLSVAVQVTGVVAALSAALGRGRGSRRREPTADDAASMIAPFIAASTFRSVGGLDDD